MTALTINGRTVDVAAEPDTPLLWVIREHLKLTGTKFGCGVAQCGACSAWRASVSTMRTPELRKASSRKRGSRVA